MVNAYRSLLDLVSRTKDNDRIAIALATFSGIVQNFSRLTEASGVTILRKAIADRSVPQTPPFSLSFSELRRIREKLSQVRSRLS
jgi:hypothetical protein